MTGIRPLVLVVLLLAGGAVHGAEFVAKVIAVLDGDTVLVRRNGSTVKIRLAGIDAPEKTQTFGETSRRSLSGMVLGKQVKISSQATDQYGRMIAHLSVADMDVNAEQIRRGLAWEYSRFHADKVLLALQDEARRAPRGLWALSNPVPPWEWRKLHPFSPSPATASVPEIANAKLPDPACGNKKHCSEMTSCEEARRYLKHCGPKNLDGDRDGVPCEKLCRPDSFNHPKEKS